MDNEKKAERRDIFPFFLTGALFVLIDSLALLITRPFEAAGIIAFENPTDPLNLVFFFLTLIVFTVIILLISKFRMKQLVQGIVLGATGLLFFYVIYPFLAAAVPELWSLVFSATVVAFMLILLVKFPEWYVIDICGILVGSQH